MNLGSTVQLARARAGLEKVDGLPLVDPGRLSVQGAGGGPGLDYLRWYEPIEQLAACLRDCDVHPGDCVLLLAETRLEWMQADLAVASAGGLTVPVYPTLPASQIAEILADSGAHLAIVSQRAVLEELLRAASSSGQIRTCILMPAEFPATPEKPSPPAEDASSRLEIRILSWEEALERGRSAPAETRARLESIRGALRAEDPATLIYTSGTTGRMKGVLLTHGNLLASAIGSAQRFEVGPDDFYLSFLPLSHVLERVVHLSMLWAGARICYSEGLDRLEQDFRRWRPTIVVGVPRLYEKIVREAEEKARRMGRRFLLLFRLAERAARRVGRRGPRLRPAGPSGWIWEALVYRRLRRALGGRVRCMISGGAPLGLREALFLNGTGLTLVEGYGLTETASVVTVCTPREWRLGSVGKSLPGIEVQVAEDGEILIRGASVMRGYFRDESASREALREGWLHTGDVGRLDPDGFLFVTDRKKDLIATAQGKKIAPQTVEGALRRSPLIREVVVVGDRRPHLAALIFPDLEQLRARLALRLPEGPDLASRINAPMVRNLIRAEVDRQSAELAPHELVREFLLLPNPPLLSDGSLTPTLKVRRGEIEKRYAKEIAGLYARA